MLWRLLAAFTLATLPVTIRRFAGIPIDMVGGTSIGAFMGGLWAMHRDVATVREKAALFCGKMSSVLSRILDLTFPFTSIFSGASFNRGLQSVFQEQQIEVDLSVIWTPMFLIKPRLCGIFYRQSGSIFERPHLADGCTF